MADISHEIVSSLEQEEKAEYYQSSKKMVLNFLFRNLCFVDEQSKIKTLTPKELDKIGLYTNLSNRIVVPIIDQFLVNARNFKVFFSSKAITWEYDRVKLIKKVRIYLHKLHRMAPVFSYIRAKANLNILHQLLEQKNHWPHITTQIALVIFITDRNNKKINDNRYIIQKNLRAFCDCSAYAFHHARNILRINTTGDIY